MTEFSVREADVLACVENGERLEGSGNQGSIHIGNVGERKILVKSAGAKGAKAWMCRRLLRHEYSVYCQLAGVKGVPRCYGFINGRHLVLEYIDSQTMRSTSISNRDSFYEELFAIIDSIHARGVAHGDLKRKDNILVVSHRHPCLIDFGVSTVRKHGFHPLNNFWHTFSLQHDLNAWLKHKYGRKYQDMSPEDTRYYRPMWIEKIARVIKRIWCFISNKKKALLTH